MKNLILLSVFSLGLFVDVAQSIFLGPIAVGFGVGALLVAKGFLAGALIAGKRSQRHGRYRRHSYSPRNHYNSNYNSGYAHSPSYYYTSSQKYHYRGKRSASEFSFEQLHRIRREAENFDFENWILDMSSKDQDDCSKKLICELSAKSSISSRVTQEEKKIAKMFSKAVVVDSAEVEFNLAAQIGRKKGRKRCQELYKRCETSVEDMMSMINVELEAMREVELQIEGLSQDEIQSQIEAEDKELHSKIIEAGIEEDRLWD